MTLIKGISGAVTDVRAMDDHDLNAEDWEPKPAPLEPFEAEVWVSGSEVYSAVPSVLAHWSWRKIRVREVTE